MHKMNKKIKTGILLCLPLVLFMLVSFCTSVYIIYTISPGAAGFVVALAAVCVLALKGLSLLY
jgi:hypothetical protein